MEARLCLFCSLTWPTEHERMILCTFAGELWPSLTSCVGTHTLRLCAVKADRNLPLKRSRTSDVDNHTPSWFEADGVL